MISREDERGSKGISWRTIFENDRMTGAGDGIRTRDIDLGKVALYQLSYSRLKRNLHFLLTAGKLSNFHRNRWWLGFGVKRV